MHGSRTSAPQGHAQQAQGSASTTATTKAVSRSLLSAGRSRRRRPPAALLLIGLLLAAVLLAAAPAALATPPLVVPAIQQAKLVAGDAAQYDAFGYSVAIDGDTALIGACQANTTGTGVAYIFTRTGTTWSQQATSGPACSRA